MVIYITSTTDSNLEDVHYILVKEGETIKITRKLASNSGTKSLTYKDAYQPILTTLSASSHILVYEWVDSTTSDKGLILIRYTYGATHFTVHDAISLDVHTNGYMKMIYDYDAYLSIMYEDDDGTLSSVQLVLDGLKPINYVKLKMPLYQEAWFVIFNVGFSFDYICYVENNKFKIVSFVWTRFPEWCEEYQSQRVSLTNLNKANFTGEWIDHNGLNQQVDNFLHYAETLYTDSSAASAQGNFTEVQCLKMRSSLNDLLFHDLTLNKNSSAGPYSASSYFSAYYNFSCALNTSKGIGFTDYIVDSTVRFDNGTIASWAIINQGDGYLYLGNVSVNTYEDHVRLVINASNDQGLEAFGYANITIVNLPPYNNTALSNLTSVAGSSNQTYNVSGLFSDYEGENITLTSDTSNSDCVEFESNVFNIVPKNWNTN